MLRFVGNRLLVAVPVIWGVVTIVFVLTRLLPGDPVETMLSQSGGSAEAIQALRSQLALDQPLPMQYVHFLSNVVRGDLGRSLFTNRPVTTTLLEQLPSTISLALSAMVFAALFGILLGVLAAVKSNTWVDNLCMSLAVVGVSVPIYWSGIVFIIVFSALLRWLPATGQGSLRQLIMPAAVLGFASAGAIARLVRANMLEILAQDYVVTARAKGLTEWVTVWRHALRNALIPAVTLIGLQLGFLLGGAVVTEVVFARQGIGRLVVQSIEWKDFPVIQGAVLLSALTYSVLNIGIDLIYALIDPRLRRQIS